MELVYLWVEEYKNIHKQGFNFSPRFSCSYDEEKKELTIDENNDYIENFFGDNINVTAIVGKNGSGKSSLIKLIFLLVFIKKYNMDENPIYDNSIIESIRPFVDKELFLIIYHDNQYKKISMYDFINKLVRKFPDTKDIIVGTRRNIPICKLETYKELNQSELDFFSVHFNYMLDTLYDGVQDKWVKEIYHKADSYDTPLLLEPYKNNNDRQIIDLDIIEYLNNQNMLRFYSSFSSNKKINKFFNPNKIYLSIATREFDLSSLNDTDFNCLKECVNFISYKFYRIYEDNDTFLMLREDTNNKICNICTTIQSLYENKKYNDLSYLYIALKVLSSSRKLFKNEEYIKINKWASELENEDQLLGFIPNIKLEGLIDESAPNYEVRKIQTSISFIQESRKKKKKLIDNMDKIVVLDEVKEILKFIPPWINIEWLEDEKSIKSLSSGEKTFFTFLINVMYQVKNLNDEDKYNTINLFLDETELGFHPKWHKEYLSNILEALKSVNKKKVNIIFATHSPFLLSDLSKENVIFLQDGKQNKGVDHKQTFGANIHTLLSDSFFMEDGLMGEFAKSKIDSVIKLLNKDKLDEDELRYCEQIISVVGEPIIKNQLQRMLDSKRLKKIDKIDELEVELALIKHRIEIIRKSQ